MRHANPAPAVFLGTKRFEIIRPLGAGGMGVVHEAFDRDRHVRVALKTMKHLSGETLLLFKNEFRALQDITHPNLIGLGELIEEEGHLFFTMELVEGVDLLSWVRPTGADGSSGIISRDQPTVAFARSAPPDSSLGLDDHASEFLATPSAGFDEQRLRRGLSQLASALSALHASGKIHRDIKPSNVLVTAEGRVVVLDFGLVVDVAAARTPGSGRVVGTVNYMAPEQAAGAPVAPAADWYSVGVLLFRALTGAFPFRGAPAAVLRDKQWDEAPPPRALASDLPADLDALCSDLLRLDPAARPSASEVLRRLCPDDDAAHLEIAALGTSFVGRVNELGALDRSLEVALGGRPVTVLVEGESGVGKSALTRQFLARIGGDGGATVLAGRCYERESVPYKAVDEVIDGLCQWLTGLDDDEATALMPTNAHLLALAFPVLGQVGAIRAACLALPDAAEAPRSRAMVFASVRELFARIAARRPLVVWIDDLQWADADSLALLAEVLRGNASDGPTRLLLIATLRGGAALGPQLARLPGVIHRLAVGALGDDDARALAVGILRSAGPGALIDVDALTREAGGHPLFLDALLRHRLVYGGDGAVHLDDALHARIERLPAEARRVLEAVVVAGGPVHQGTVAEAVGVQLGDLLKPLAALRAAHLVRTAGAALDELVEPFHDRVRELAVRRLDPVVLRSWHERLATAIERSGRGDWEQLAVHWRDAGVPDRALGHAIRAADEAVAALAFDRAARLFRLAITLQRENRAATRALQIRLGDTLTHAGRGEEAAEVRFAAADGAPADQAHALRRCAMENLFQCGRYEAGIAALEAMLGELGMTLPRTSAGVLASLAWQRMRLRVRGLGYRERVATAIDPRLLQRADLAWSAGIAFGLVDIFLAADFQCRSLLYSLQAGEPGRIARALAAEALFGATPGSRASARTADQLACAEDLTVRLGDPRAQAMVAYSRGVAACFEGRFGDGVIACDRAQAVYAERNVGMDWELSTVQLVGIWCLLMAGDVEDLFRRFPALLRESDEHRNLSLSTCLRSSISNGYWLLRGELDEARRAADLANEGFYPGVQLRHAYDLIARTQIDLYAGEGEAAYARFAERLPAITRSLCLRMQVVRILLIDFHARAALAAACAGPPSARDRLLAAAARDASALELDGAPWGKSLAALRRAGIAAVQGDTAHESGYLVTAIRGFDAVPMKLFAAAARVRLAELCGDEAPVLQRMQSWGVVEPARIVEMLAPGFPAAGSLARSV